MRTPRIDAAAREVKFRNPELARRLSARIAELTAGIGRSPVSVMHVCGSHEQAIARWGLRATFPKALNVIMGPGCPSVSRTCPRSTRAWPSRARASSSPPTETW